MVKLKRNPIALTLVLMTLMPIAACSVGGDNVSTATPFVNSVTPAPYSWIKVTDNADFPAAYNFPVFTVRNQMWAFHHEGNWSSTDGRTWTKSELPVSGLNSGTQKFVQFNDAIYALGTMEGNISNMRLSSRITRTSDFKRWEVIAENPALPARIFYGAVAFNNKIWFMGGYDGRLYFNDVWNSSDGAEWTRVAESTKWSPRNVGACVVFKNRIWIIGGGLIDGTPSDKRSETEVWSSIDGINWRLETDKMARLWGASPVVYDDKLWLVGANRDGNFSRAAIVTDDGVTWREEIAPWSPRGAVATWVFDNKLYLTGGKYSTDENGEIKFIYSNDVWYMARSSK